MSLRSLLAGAFAFALPLAITPPIAFAQAPAASASPAPPCTTEGKGVKYICGQKRAEDLFHLPGTDWVLGSWLGGGVVAIGVKSHATTVLYPSPTAKVAFDKATYRDCPGEPTKEQQERFSVAGIGVHQKGPGVYTVYADHYGQERAVDVFEVDIRNAAPEATWVGCVLAPEPIGLDTVAVLPDGSGFIGSNWVPRGTGRAVESARMMAGEENGELWLWKPTSGWEMIPGSKSSGPNGVEISKDGKYVFTPTYGRRSILRLTLGLDTPQRVEVPVGYRMDNIHWTPDGQLIGAGQGCFGGECQRLKNTYHVSIIDPITMKVTEIIKGMSDDVFGSATVAIQVGDEIWVGSYRSDRIAIFPMPKK